MNSYKIELKHNKQIYHDLEIIRIKLYETTNQLKQANNEIIQLKYLIDDCKVIINKNEEKIDYYKQLLYQIKQSLIHAANHEKIHLNKQQILKNKIIKLDKKANKYQDKIRKLLQINQ